MGLTIPEFYKGKNVLVTGATGFLGKALVEKLLRACPGINIIYILMRSKRGVTADERLQELWNNKIFEQIKLKQLDAFKKLKLITGDILEDGLGISDADREELQENCNIVFHSAACIRFDQKLKDAVNMNIKGTLRVLELAETMKNIETLVHLSTAYCRCYLDVLEEKMYPAVHNPRKVIDLVDWMDDITLSRIEPILIASEPNTYSFTKAITENLVAEYSSKFPIAIGRLSLVTAAYKEPIPGWVDNLNGLTGLLIGAGKGVIRTMVANESNLADMYPVDMAVNGCILISYFSAINRSKDVQVYNLTQSRQNPATWKELLETGRQTVDEYPFSVSLWYPGGSVKRYKYLHEIDAFFTHFLRAYIIDVLLVLIGQKTFMVNLQKRIDDGIKVIQHYTTKQWDFKNELFRSLSEKITKEDNDIFYTDITVMKWSDYAKDYVLGAREFCCNENISTLPQARRRQRMLFYMDIILKGIFLLFNVFVIYWLFFKY